MRQFCTRKSIRVIVFASTVLGCHAEESALKHKWGETWVPPQRTPEKCQASHDERFNVARDYLQKLAEVMAAGNQSVFGEGQPYPMGQICFGVKDDLSLIREDFRGVNGWANGRTWSITITPLTFLYAQTDQDVASVLSHELAHLTRQHYVSGDSATSEYIAYRHGNVGGLRELDAALNAKQLELKAARERLQKQDAKLIEDLSREVGTVVDQLLQDPAFAKQEQRIEDISTKLYGGFSGFFFAGEIEESKLMLGFALFRKTGESRFREFDNGSRLQFYRYSEEDVDSLRQKFALVVEQEQILTQELAKLVDRRRMQIGARIPTEFKDSFARYFGAKSGGIKGSVSLDEGLWPLIEEVRQLEQQRSQLLYRANLTPSFLSTSAEQEADDVGLEFYVRAGYPVASYSFMSRHFAVHFEKGASKSGSDELSQITPADDLTELMNQCLLIRQRRLLGIPWRGYWSPENEPYLSIPGRISSHPTSCWRLHHLLNVEAEVHKDQIQALKRPTPQAVAKPTLQEVQDVLRPLLVDDLAAYERSRSIAPPIADKAPSETRVPVVISGG